MRRGIGSGQWGPTSYVMRAVLVTFLVLLVGLVADVASVSAKPSAASKLNADREPIDTVALEHLKRGNRAFDLNDYDAAIAEYKLGAIRDPVPLFWLNIGLAHRKAGRYAEAIDYCRDFLDRSTNDADPNGRRDQIAQLIPKLEEARDAQPTRPTPSASSTPPPPAPATATAAVPLAQPSGGHSDTAVTASTSRWHDKLAWGLVAGGVVAAGVGSGLLLNASSLDDEADHETDFARRNQLHDNASSRRTEGVVAVAGGGALLVAAVIKFALASPSPSATKSAQITPGPGDVGLGFTFDF